MESFVIQKRLGLLLGASFRPITGTAISAGVSLPVGSRFLKEPLEEEKLLEGKYLILTEEKHLSAVEAVSRLQGAYPSGAGL